MGEGQEGREKCLPTYREAQLTLLGGRGVGQENHFAFEQNIWKRSKRSETEGHGRLCIKLVHSLNSSIIYCLHNALYSTTKIILL